MTTPYPLPDDDMCEAAGIVRWHRVDGELQETPQFRAWRDGAMRSQLWCYIHDLEVQQQLKDGASVVNTKHHFGARRGIYGWFRGDRPIQPPYTKHSETWTSYALTTVVVRDAVGDSEPPTGGGDTDPAPDSGALPEPDQWRPLLKLGMSGRDVEAWQVQLVADGFADDFQRGEFDAYNDECTRCWQEDRELQADGVVGPITRSAIGSPPVPVPDDPPPLVVVAGAELLPDPMQFIQAKNFTKGPRSRVHQILLHASENPPVDDRGTADPSDDIARPWVALGVARWGAGQDWRGYPARAPNASWHAVIGGDVDPYNGVIQCLRTEDIAWTAGMRVVNGYSINYEMIGQTYVTDWDSPIIRPTLERTAAMMARDARQWNIPLRALSVENMQEAYDLTVAGVEDLPERCRGVGTHARVTLTFKVPGGHTDPWGLQDQLFQMDRMLEMAREY
jgi:hypothetical protein